MKLVNIRETGGSRTGSIKNLSYQYVVERIGKPNVTDMDDESKVKASWGLEDEDTGRQLFVWSYKDDNPRNHCQNWSADGEPSLLKEVFGDAYNG